MYSHSRFTAVVGAILGGTGVALGAFAAHGLRAHMSTEALGWWQTAVEYQMWHAIGLLAIAALGAQSMRVPASLLAAGTTIFSGSLYVMALTDARWLGAITPIGGVLMIAGWTWLAWRLAKAPNPS
jgi:uncharacterized membrane protein YgdD (TMEM256/DUF423 family)